MHLTKRDFDLFYYLFRHKVALTRQIRRDVFMGSSRESVVRRMQKLVRSGYVEKKALEGGNSLSRIYSLTKKGFKAIEIKEEIDVSEFVLGSDSVDHDLELVDIFSLIHRFNIVDRLLTENELRCRKLYLESDDYRRFSILRSDGLLSYKMGNEVRHVALEFERVQKTEYRYVEKISDYYNMTEIESVLFFAGNDQILRKVREMDKVANEKLEPKFFFSTLSELQKQSDELFLYSNSEMKFKLS